MGHSFPVWETGKNLSAKFGWRLRLMWPFGETNVAAMGTLETAGRLIPREGDFSRRY
jgi:hypothetical protein